MPHIDKETFKQIFRDHWELLRLKMIVRNCTTMSVQ